MGGRRSEMSTLRHHIRKVHYRLKYPKLLLLFLTIMLGVVLFRHGTGSAASHDLLVSLGHLGTFLGGVFYAYGFTAAPATAVLLVLAKEQNLLVAVLVGGLGALLSDLLLFAFVRYSFMDEIHELEKEKVVRFVEHEERVVFGHYYRHVFPVFAGFLIASPLPTEIGVSMMASVKKLSMKKFLLVAYPLHSLGIFVILLVDFFL